MRISIALLAALLLPIAGYAAQPLRVVTSFSILADMTRNVAGENAQVSSLVGPDGDAHVYEPTPADARSIADADIVIVNGLGFEGWMDRLMASADFRGRVIVASEGLTPLMAANTPDPHAWQSLGNGKAYVVNIMNALEKADPTHAETYEKNAASYLHQLGALDVWVRDQIARIPKDKRIAITTHDALGYFAAGYGVTFIAPFGLTTSGDVSAGQMARLIDQIRTRHVRAVFLENISDPRLIKQLVADGGAVLGGTLYSDALSKPDGPAPSYIALFRHNVTALTEAMRKN